MVTISRQRLVQREQIRLHYPWFERQTVRPGIRLHQMKQGIVDSAIGLERQ